VGPYLFPTVALVGIALDIESPALSAVLPNGIVVCVNAEFARASSAMNKPIRLGTVTPVLVLLMTYPSDPYVNLH
jgi:hypothetical protein